MSPSQRPPLQSHATQNCSLVVAAYPLCEGHRDGDSSHIHVAFLRHSQPTGRVKSRTLPDCCMSNYAVLPASDQLSGHPDTRLESAFQFGIIENKPRRQCPGGQNALPSKKYLVREFTQNQRDHIPR